MRAAIWEWFTDAPIDNTLQLAALIALGFAIWRWGRPMLADAVRIRDLLLGRPAVLDSITDEEIEPELPGLGVRVRAMEQTQEYMAAQLNVVEHEVRNNNGSSLKDSVHRGEERLARLENAVAELADRLVHNRG